MCLPGLGRPRRSDREVFHYTMVLLYDTKPKMVSMRYKPHDWDVIIRMQNELIEAYEQTYPNYTLKIVFSGFYLVRFIPLLKANERM
jgi:hypothetical protein